MEIINPLKSKTRNGWHFEQEIFGADGLIRAVKAGGGSGNIPKVIIDAQPIRRKRTEEERRRRHLYGDKGAKFSAREMEVGTGGVMSAITTVYDKDNIIAEIDMGKELQNKRYRIRKLTPRECFRLMDLNENDIDKIQASGVSESQQYKMAGNSIVVACMVGIFRNLFSNEEQETLTLF